MNPQAPFVPAPQPLAPPAPVASAPPAFVPSPQPLAAPMAPQPAPAFVPVPQPPAADAPKYYTLIGGVVDQTPKTADEIRNMGVDLNTISVVPVGESQWQPGNSIRDAAQPVPILAPPPGTNPVPFPTPGRVNPAITTPAPGKEDGGSGEVVGGFDPNAQPNQDGFIPGEEVSYERLAKHLRGQHNGNVPNQGVGEGKPLPVRHETSLRS